MFIVNVALLFICFSSFDINKQMDLQHLTTQQMNMVFTVADILSMEDLLTIADVLASYDWNIETALNQLQIGDAPPVQNKQSQDKINNIVPPDFNKVNLIPEYLLQDLQLKQSEKQLDIKNGEKINEKKQMFEEEYITFIPLHKTASEPNKGLMLLQNHKEVLKNKKDYVMRQKIMNVIAEKAEEICHEIFSSHSKSKVKYHQSKAKVQNNKLFINYFYSQFQTNFNFTFGTFYLNLAKSFLQDKLLLVYVHTLEEIVQQNYKEIMKVLLSNKNAAALVNDNCIAYGMFDNSDDFQTMQHYVRLNELPAFLLFRFDKMLKSQQMVSIYKIKDKTVSFLNWLTNSLDNHTKDTTDKQKLSQIQKYKINKTEQQYNNEQINEQYMSYYQELKIKQEQDDLYAELEKTYLNKRMLSKMKKEQINKLEEQLKNRVNQALMQAQPEQGQYVIEIKFRVPVYGNLKVRRFNQSDKIQKLFEYVDCFCRQYFQQKFSDFDLRQTFPPLNLLTCKQKQISEVFPDSRKQNIIIKQL